MVAPQTRATPLCLIDLGPLDDEGRFFTFASHFSVLKVLLVPLFVIGLESGP